MDQSLSADPTRVVSNGYVVENQPNGDLNTNGSLRRRGSFSFLRRSSRSKSRDRSASGSSTPARKLSKKRLRGREMHQEQIPVAAPRVPLVPAVPDLPTFGGEDVRPDGAEIMSSRVEGSYQKRLAQKQSQEAVRSQTYRGMSIPPVPPIPPIPGHTPTIRSAASDPWHREESMAHRGRYSYASSAVSTINSPRKIRRRKDPTPYNILILGARNSGKSSFVNFLQTSLALPTWKQRHTNPEDDFETPFIKEAFPSFTSHYVETEIHKERVGVTLWDSEGFELNMVDLQLKEVTNFLESKFENTYSEESKVARTPGFRDTHIHCVLLLLDPGRLDANIRAPTNGHSIDGAKARSNSFVKAASKFSTGGLDENLDLNVLRALKGKTTVVPIIAKADTVSSAHMAHLKQAVWKSLKENGLETLDGLLQEEDANSVSDTSNEAEAIQIFNMVHPTQPKQNGIVSRSDEDKFSMTSHLESSTDSDSAFSAAGFDFGNLRKASANREKAVLSPPSPPPLRPFTPSPADPPPLPLSIISPDPYDDASPTGIFGRRFPWGFADPLNAGHCDFVSLKDQLFQEWRVDLKEASRQIWYEGWRTSRLNKKTRRQGTISLAVGSPEMRTPSSAAGGWTGTWTGT